MKRQQKILVLGATGMLGHKLVQVLQSEFSVTGSVRGSTETYAAHPVLRAIPLVGGVRAETFESVDCAVTDARPHVVVNCIGVVKQAAEARDEQLLMNVNTQLPLKLEQHCASSGIRLIHISTDCVFSGSKGFYSESDTPDPVDAYGKSKLSGEITGEGCLTLRTSMIGRELVGNHGLLEWFLSQRGKTVKGYRKAIFSGLTTRALATVIARLIRDFPQMNGLWHVAARPINKFDLLTLVQKIYGLEIKIEPDETVVCDRSLNAEKFHAATGIVPSSWEEMIQDTFLDPTPYETIRRSYAH